MVQSENIQFAPVSRETEEEETGPGSQIIDALTGIEPVSIREAARLVNRDVKAVHGDIHALLNAGILRKEDNKISFPFDRVLQRARV